MSLGQQGGGVGGVGGWQTACHIMLHSIIIPTSPV
jgi:hypothetical protein